MRRPRTPLWLLIAQTLVLLLLARHATADADDTINLTVGANAQHDSNLFRLPSGADTRALIGHSSGAESISTTSVSLKLNKPYSLQRFELEATMIDARYQTFDYLSYTALNYASAWRWMLTPNFHGNLTATKTEQPNSFNDYSGYHIKNLRTTQAEHFDGEFKVTGTWRLVAGVGQTTNTNSKLFVQQGDDRIDTANAGIRYDFLSGSSLAYMNRTGRGAYTQRPQPIPGVLFDNGFDDVDNSLLLNWRVTGKTTVNARASHFQRTSNNYSARSYGGNVGNLNINWEVTGKTRINATLARELTSYQQLSSSYISTDRISINPTWQISAKTALRLGYEYAQMDYLGAITVTPLNGRVDNMRTGSIALDWQPLRSFTISGSLQKGQRDSNQTGFDYKSTTAGVSAQLTL